jgi:hypothetical protein
MVYNSSNSATAYLNGAPGSQVTGLSWTAGSLANFYIGNYPVFTSDSQIGYQSEIVVWQGVNPSVANQAIYDLNTAAFFGITGVTQ